MEVRCRYCKSKMSDGVEVCPRCDTPRSANQEPAVEGKATPVWVWIVGVPVGFVAVVFLASLFHVVTESPEQSRAEDQAYHQQQISAEADRIEAEQKREREIAWELARRQLGVK